MPATRRGFLQTAALGGAAARATGAAPTEKAKLDGFQIARRHVMLRTQATPDFFEGLLLGNGDVGLSITVRPDALGLHIGKNNSWDIRVSEEHAAHILPFQKFLELWERASQEAKREGKPEMLHLERDIAFFHEYTQKMHSSYSKPWPRPWPCGVVWLHWDSRMVRVVRQTLNPADGVATIDLEHDDLKGKVRRFRITCFVSQDTGHVSLSSDQPAPILSAAYIPHVDASAKLPHPELGFEPGAGFADFTCYQHFPATAPTANEPDPPRSPNDSSFAIHGRLQGDWSRDQGPDRVFLKSPSTRALRLDLTIFTAREHADSRGQAKREAERLSRASLAELRAPSERFWRGFWSRSAVEFADRELERIWYHNQYFLACCLREGKVAPGLFGNWTSGKIGTSWHGDYHLDYNTEQIYWGVFASNHAEQHFPYVELLEKIQPMVKDIAREHFGMPGAFYPVTVYPVPSRVNPYPAPPWFYMMCDAPWAVQSLWWHYLYTQDEELLRRVYPMLADVARFMTAYLKKQEDGKYHIVPTVSSENWGCTVDYRLNRDATMDLAFTAFVLAAAVEGAKILRIDAGERAKWAEVHANLAPYPTAVGPHGEVWLDVADAPVEHVYNVPATTTPVFPGEQVGIGLRPELLELARRTTKLIRLEGGNDLVYQPLTRARLGMLDLEWFKREVRYALLPNGTCYDRVRQIDGRYSDRTDFGYMERMGIWVENLALPAVLNECMLQSYTGVIRLFPNTTNLNPAKFAGLRCVGAFLIEAEWNGQAVSSPVVLTSEKGARCRIANPWTKGQARVLRMRDTQPVTVKEAGGVLEFPTHAGERYRLERTSS